METTSGEIKISRAHHQKRKTYNHPCFSWQPLFWFQFSPAFFISCTISLALSLSPAHPTQVYCKFFPRRICQAWQLCFTESRSLRAVFFRQIYSLELQKAALLLSLIRHLAKRVGWAYSVGKCNGLTMGGEEPASESRACRSDLRSQFQSWRLNVLQSGATQSMYLFGEDRIFYLSLYSHPFRVGFLLDFVFLFAVS